MPTGDFNHLISQFDHRQFHFFTIKNGYYVFAETKEAMDCYTGETSHHGYLTDNPYFKFSNDNLATANLLEFTYYNDPTKHPLQQFLSEKGKLSHTGQDLMIFSISCNELAGKYATTNIYLHFGKQEQSVSESEEFQV